MFSKHRSVDSQREPIEQPNGWATYDCALKLIEHADWPSALECLAEAETQFHADDHLPGLWRAQLGQALLHWRDGAASMAVARASAALRTAEQSDDGMAVGCVTWHLAHLLLGGAEYRRAADYLDQAQLALDAVGMAPPGGTLAAAAQLCHEIVRWQQMCERQQVGRREAEAAITDIQRLLTSRLAQAASALHTVPLLPSALGAHELLLLLPSLPGPLDLPEELIAPQLGLSEWLRRLWRRLIYGDDIAEVEPLTRVPQTAPEPPPPHEQPGTDLAYLALARRQPAVGQSLADHQPATATNSSLPEHNPSLVYAPPMAHGQSYVGATIEIAPAVDAAQNGMSNNGMPPEPGLLIHLLGPFRVTLNGQPIESWPSGRGRALFKYLLAHRDRPLPRDTLMEVFWPDALPEAARNSLNVAMHGLRQALKAAAAATPVVVFQNGIYQLSPDLPVWIDVEEFRRRVQAGRRHEDAGNARAAAAEYEQAIALYQGDFMADDLADDWPVLPRERLRVAYLDTLDRLSTLSFEQGQYAMCISLCQQLLALDACREDTHCRLMRCYSRQGQHHLALRQYQLCAEALRGELDVEPAASTAQLYERIRRREEV